MNKQIQYRKLFFPILMMFICLSSYSQRKSGYSANFQYWDGSQWVMVPAGVPGQVLKLSNSRIPTWSYTLGSTGPAGGVIFYDKGDYSDGWRYLEASRADQSTEIGWSCSGTDISVKCSSAIGTGRANTTAIVNSCGQSVIAARICDDLVLNGYSDWFLPSKDELARMYLIEEEIGGFHTSPYSNLTDHSYWSSSTTCTETNSSCPNRPWSQFFDGGGFQSNSQISCPNMHVRAIRAF